MPQPDHYKILGLTSSASQAEIKQVYRALAKQFHPDRQVGQADTQSSAERMIHINAAYEVLGDTERRRHYDRLRYYGATEPDSPTYNAYAQAERSAQSRSDRTQAAQQKVRRRTSGRATEGAVADWMKQIYNPIDRQINQILRPLNAQINELSADPFDDSLMDVFMAYLEECRAIQEKADSLFKSRPNPAGAAGPASKLYYAINHISDGLDELELFTSCYEESYLHSGKELFRRAKQFRKEAQDALKQMVS